MTGRAIVPDNVYLVTSRLPHQDRFLIELAPVNRVDNVYEDRNVVCTCPTTDM
jgi:hypothetical protein